MLVLAACSDGPRAESEAPPGGDARGKQEDQGSADAGADAAAFPQALSPTPITGAYLTAYRDRPSEFDDPDHVVVFGVLRDAATGKALPKPIRIEEASATFGDQTTVAGDLDADPAHDYHVRYRIPKAFLIADGIGKDRIDGAVRVVSSATPEREHETSVVIWLAQVALTAERSDYGMLVLPPGGETPPVLRIAVAVANHEQAAEGALLKGLGAELQVTGGTCPRLGETAPVDLTTDCTIELTPTEVARLDRVLTVTYYNGVRTDFASVVVRGETVVMLDRRSATATRDGLPDPEWDISSPGQVMVHDGRLFVADNGRSRVLIWNGLPRRSSTLPDAVLGGRNPIVTPNDSGGYNVFYPGAYPRVVSPITLSSPLTMTTAGRRLVVGDAGDERILIWNTMPAASTVPADLVLGRRTLTSTDPVVGAAATGGSDSLIWDGARLVSVARGYGAPETADTFAAGRIWNGLPAASFRAADAVIGGTHTTTASRRYIGKLSFDGRRYLESLSDRLHIYKQWPLDLDRPDVVLGATGPLPQGSGHGMASSDGTTLVQARGSSVLVWYRIPEASDTPPDVVLGQPDASTNIPNAYGRGPESLATPGGVAIAGDKLVIADSGNHRVIVRPLPRPRQELALAEPARESDGGEVTPALLRFRELFYQLGVIDIQETTVRELQVFHSGTTPARIVQAAFDDGAFRFVGGAYPGTGGTCGAVITASCTIRIAVATRRQAALQGTLQLRYDNGSSRRDATVTIIASPRYIAARMQPRPAGREASFLGPGGSGKLVVFDNHDCSPVDVINAGAAPTVTASVTLVGDAENPCTTKLRMAYAAGGRLHVVGASRLVSVWRSVPAASGTPPDLSLPVAIGNRYVETPVAMLGDRLYATATGCKLYGWSSVPDASGVQPTFTLDGTTLPERICPWVVMAVRGKLVAVEAVPGGTRLLIWSTPPVAATPPDTIVPLSIGPMAYGEQPDMPRLQGYNMWTTDGQRLYFADSVRARVLVWNGIPAPGQAPDIVLGQLTPTGNLPHDGGFGPWSMSSPRFIFAQDGELYVHDGSRVLVYRLRD